MRIIAKRANRSGFTLMELMAAAVILALALAGLLGAFVGNFNLIGLARNLTIATNHARSVMEEIRERNIPSFITTEDWTGWAQQDAPGGGGCNTLNNENVQVSFPSGVGANPLQVLITVNWTEKGRPRNTQFVTLITER